MSHRIYGLRKQVTEAKEGLLELRRKREARKTPQGKRVGKGADMPQRESHVRSSVLRAFKGGDFRGQNRGGSQ